MTRQVRVLPLVLVFLSTTRLLSQSGNADSTFHAIESLFDSGSYLAAEVEARRLLEWPDLTDSTIAFGEKWIAFSLVAQGKPVLAKDHFVTLCRLIPQFDLDPALTSPKILNVFLEAKRSVQLERESSQRAHQVDVQSNSEVSIRTILFPGWEQLYTGRNSGYVFLGAGVATLGTGFVMEVLRSSARDKYLSEQSPSQIQSAYDTYNRYYKAEKISFIAFALVYVASEIDVFTSVPANPRVEVSFGGDSPQLKFSYHF